MEESRRLAMRRAHAGRKFWCTCGAIVRGNGGCASHRAMHERNGEWRTEGGYFYMTTTELERRAKAAALVQSN